MPAGDARGMPVLRGWVVESRERLQRRFAVWSFFVGFGGGVTIVAEEMVFFLLVGSIRVYKGLMIRSLKINRVYLSLRNPYY